MPFGVLEMLASSIPVFAYDSPGAPMMLPPRYLVAPGNAMDMGRRVVALLNDRNKLAGERVWAQARSQEFSWNRSAELTSQLYREHIQRKLDR